MINELHEKSKIAELGINVGKTSQIIANKEYEQDVRIEGRKIEKKEDVVYLGQNIGFNKKVKRRIKIGWAKFWALKRIFKDTFRTSIKSKVFNACIVPAVSYGLQTWIMRKKEKDGPQVMQTKMEKAMLDIKQITRIRTSEIKKKMLENKNIVEECLLRKWDWAGHLARHGGDKWTGKVTDWYFGYGNRNRGIQKIRWSNDFKSLLMYKIYHRVAMCRPEWQKLRRGFAQKGNKYFWGLSRRKL